MNGPKSPIETSDGGLSKPLEVTDVLRKQVGHLRHNLTQRRLHLIYPEQYNPIKYLYLLIQDEFKLDKSGDY